MDGVLVDVSESYRETIVRAVEFCTRQTIPRELIQDYKNQGGYNNDWLLTQKICADLGVEVDYGTVVARFNDFFLNQGLIHRERWLPLPGLLEELAERFELAIFTGRTTYEAQIPLKPQGGMAKFDLVASC